MSTMLGPRLREPLSCLNPRLGRRRDDTELRIWKDIDGCSWHETSPHAIHEQRERNAVPPNKGMELTVNSDTPFARRRAEGAPLSPAPYPRR